MKASLFLTSVAGIMQSLIIKLYCHTDIHYTVITFDNLKKTLVLQQ